MSTRIYSVVVVILLVSCQSSTETEQAGNEGGLSMTAQFHESLPEYSLKANIDKDEMTIHAGEEFVQVIKLGSDELYGYEDLSSFLSIADYNFDGYLDIKYPVTTGSGGEFVKIWLWNVDEGQLITSDDMDLTSPEFDKENETITIHDVGGMAGMWYVRRTFRYKDAARGTLALLRSEEQTSYNDSDNEFIRSVYVTNDDGSVDTACVVIISSGEEGEERCLIKGEWAPCDNDPYSFGSTDDIQKYDGRNEPCHIQELEDEPGGHMGLTQEETAVARTTSGNFIGYDDNYDYWVFTVQDETGEHYNFIYGEDDKVLNRLVADSAKYRGTRIMVYWHEQMVEEAGSGEMYPAKFSVQVELLD